MVGFWGPQRVVVAAGATVGAAVGGFVTGAAVVVAFVVTGETVVVAFVVTGAEVLLVVDWITMGPFIDSVIVLISIKGTL